MMTKKSPWLVFFLSNATCTFPLVKTVLQICGDHLLSVRLTRVIRTRAVVTRRTHRFVIFDSDCWWRLLRLTIQWQSVTLFIRTCVQLYTSRLKVRYNRCANSNFLCMILICCIFVLDTKVNMHGSQSLSIYCNFLLLGNTPFRRGSRALNSISQVSFADTRPWP